MGLKMQLARESFLKELTVEPDFKWSNEYRLKTLAWVRKISSSKWSATKQKKPQNQKLNICKEW